MLSFIATGMPYKTPDGCAADACATSDLRSSLIGVRQAFSRLTLTMRSAAPLALASASLGSLTESPGPSSLLLFELPEFGHQEEAVAESGRELGRPERERRGPHFVGAEPHRVGSRHERLDPLTRRHGVDLGDVLENPRHLLGRERERLLAEQMSRILEYVAQINAILRT